MEDPDTDDQDFYELIKETIDNQDIIKKNLLEVFWKRKFFSAVKKQSNGKTLGDDDIAMKLYK